MSEQIENEQIEENGQAEESAPVNETEALLEQHESNNIEVVEDTAEETEETQEEYQARLNGYTSEEKAALAQLPVAIQKMIDGREEKFHRGYDGYREGHKFSQRINSMLADDQEYFKQAGVNNEQYISRLISIEKQLRTGSDYEKTLILQGLAHDVGIDPGSLASTQFNHYLYQLQQQNNAMKEQFARQQIDQRETQLDALEQSISNILPELDHFEELFPSIMQIIQSGMASGNTPEEKLRDAHTKAFRLNDELYNAQIAKQQQEQNVIKATNAASAAKKAAVSVKSGSPAGKSSVPEGASGFDTVMHLLSQYS